MTTPDPIEAAVTELAYIIAKCRFGPGVDMAGSHNPKVSEVHAARRFIEDWAPILTAAAYEARLERLRNYHPHGGCRTCSGRLGPPGFARPHEMRCKHYAGPLEHRWTHTRWNGTFGGIDHDCMCGGWFRKGGRAGHGDGTETAEAICPHADQDWRGPRPTVQKEEQ